MGQDGGNIVQRNNDKSKAFTVNKKDVIESLVSGTISSTVTTIVYQPLELLKTRIQIRNVNDDNLLRHQHAPKRVLGRATQYAILLTRNQGIAHLWRGTGASLLRSGPGVGLYYAILNVMQTNLSNQNFRPDNPSQAFMFGLTARSMVSLSLLPVTVVKVRYESGKFAYSSLAGALKEAYLRTGWVGTIPTILRDSLFSGTYYMCYTKLKNDKNSNDVLTNSRRFVYAVISGLIASIVTNPIDVIKTNIQVAERQSISTREVTLMLIREKGGYSRFFDGLVPRSLRRTLVAATTWTMYELILDKLNKTW